MLILATSKISIFRLPLALCHQRLFHVQSDTIVIASAVRTPSWDRLQGKLTSQLDYVAVEAAVKQSAIPVEEFKQIYLTPSAKDETDVFEFNKFLKKVKTTSVRPGKEVDAKALILGLEALKSKEVNVTLVAGAESIKENKLTTSFKSDRETINYFDKSKDNFFKAQKQGIIDAEIVPVQVLQQSDKRKILRDITQDEYPLKIKEPDELINYSDGAAALVLTTFAKCEEYALKPLGIIKDFAYCSNTLDNLTSLQKCVDNLLAKSHIDPQHIQHWEMDHTLISTFQQHFNINLDLINPYGGSLIFSPPLAVSLLRMLSHLSHTLKSSQYGCLVSHNSKESFAIIIQKFPLPSSDGLPRLTLYTKDPCHLCDMLVDELELNFSGEYDLEKIYIDTKENVRFLRLYRHDIPVVFLNGQFLCMHRLNNRLLRRKLDLLKEQ